MAEDTIDRAIHVGNIDLKACVTESMKIHGYLQNDRLDEQSLTGFYGSDLEKIEKLADSISDGKEFIHPKYPFTKAMVIWAIRHEYALHVEDVLSRRFRLLFLDANAAIEAGPKIAAIMAKELNKDENWIKAESEAFASLAKIYLL